MDTFPTQHQAPETTTLTTDSAVSERKTKKLGPPAGVSTWGLDVPAATAKLPEPVTATSKPAPVTAKAPEPATAEPIPLATHKDVASPTRVLETAKWLAPKGGKRRKIRVADLVRDLQVRVNTIADKVDEYAERQKEGTVFPPPVVLETTDGLILADGYHTVAAYEKNHGADFEVECMIHKGDRHAALLYASQANTRHGMAMSNADKRRAVTLLLPIVGETWTTRAIGDHVGVSHVLVGNMIREAKAAASGNGFQKGAKRQATRPSTKPTAAPDGPKPNAWRDRVEAAANTLAKGTDDTISTAPTHLPKTEAPDVEGVISVYREWFEVEEGRPVGGGVSVVRITHWRHAATSGLTRDGVEPTDPVLTVGPLNGDRMMLLPLDASVDEIRDAMEAAFSAEASPALSA